MLYSQVHKSDLLLCPFHLDALGLQIHLPSETGFPISGSKEFGANFLFGPQCIEVRRVYPVFILAYRIQRTLAA